MYIEGGGVLISHRSAYVHTENLLIKFLCFIYSILKFLYIRFFTIFLYTFDGNVRGMYFFFFSFFFFSSICRINLFVHTAYVSIFICTVTFCRLPSNNALFKLIWVFTCVKTHTFFTYSKAYKQTFHSKYWHSLTEQIPYWCCCEKILKSRLYTGHILSVSIRFSTTMHIF